MKRFGLVLLFVLALTSSASATGFGQRTVVRQFNGPFRSRQVIVNRPFVQRNVVVNRGFGFRQRSVVVNSFGACGLGGCGTVVQDAFGNVLVLP